MYSSEKVFLQFIRALADLLDAGVPVKKALETIRSSSKKRTCGRLADSVLHYILEGYSLSSAIQLNQVVSVRRESVSVMAAGEKTGDIVSVLRFLISGEEQREETSVHIMEVSLYPVLVLLVAGFGTLFLLRQYRQFSFTEIPAGALEGCIHAGLFLLAFLSLFCVVYYRIFSPDAVLLFFYETDFLLSSGICITDALHIISGFANKKTALIAERMLPDIRSGISFADVFRKVFPERDDSETQLFLDLASAEGNLAGACSFIWSRMKKKTDERKQLALRMAEPLLLTGTGICLLILLESVVLPFLTQFGGAL